MGLDKRMKKRIQQIDKNLDAIVKNPYEKKEIIEKNLRASHPGQDGPSLLGVLS